MHYIYNTLTYDINSGQHSSDDDYMTDSDLGSKSDLKGKPFASSGSSLPSKAPPIPAKGNKTTKVRWKQDEATGFAEQVKLTKQKTGINQQMPGGYEQYNYKIAY